MRGKKGSIGAKKEGREEVSVRRKREERKYQCEEGGRGGGGLLFLVYSRVLTVITPFSCIRPGVS